MTLPEAEEREVEQVFEELFDALDTLSEYEGQQLIAAVVARFTIATAMAG